MVNPAILNPKLILQELCRKKIEWNDITPQDISDRPFILPHFPNNPYFSEFLAEFPYMS